jgi:Putative beta-barrel porin-2, OmpL-like. bbp2
MFHNTKNDSLPVTRQKRAPAFRLLLLLLFLAVPANAQNADAHPENVSVSDLSKQVSELRALVLQLQAQVSELQRQPAAVQTATIAPSIQASPVASNRVDPPSSIPNDVTPQSLQTQSAPTNSATTSKVEDVLHGTTVNLLFDGYYAYNFNDPIGRVNLLRGYDISSNAFSLNQADVVLENAADPANGKRFGARLDLQFGQATETLQGNPANEPRPEIYRNIFQAYGTYIVPIGSGLDVDFGKWASSLGMEGNYTQDQINYSRSYWFDFLPFYHMGARVHYQFNDKFGVNYWITNGTQQTEPFNGYKDEMFGFVVTPTKNLSWTVNYYLGQEHPDFQFVTNGPPNLPTIQGEPFEPIVNPPSGKLHIFDFYATWNATNKLTLAAEVDYVIERLYTNSAPSHDDGGAAYFRCQLTPKVALAVRGEYLSDYGGLYSSKTQALKETTATFEYKFAPGFLMREEWRWDWSNQDYFLSDALGVLKKSQITATIGLVWWFGGKEGAW